MTKTELEEFQAIRVSTVDTIMDMIEKSSMSVLEKETILFEAKMLKRLLREDLPDTHPLRINARTHKGEPR